MWILKLDQKIYKLKIKLIFKKKKQQPNQFNEQKTPKSVYLFCMYVMYVYVCIENVNFREKNT